MNGTIVKCQKHMIFRECGRKHISSDGAERLTTRMFACPFTRMEDVRSPVGSGHHLIIWLISHNVINKVQTCGRTTQGKRKVILLCV